MEVGWGRGGEKGFVYMGILLHFEAFFLLIGLMKVFGMGIYNECMKL